MGRGLLGQRIADNTNQGAIDVVSPSLTRLQEVAAICFDYPSLGAGW